MGYQSDKQLDAYFTDVARKNRERRLQSYERTKNRNMRVARAFGIALVVILVLYFATRIR